MTMTDIEPRAAADLEVHALDLDWDLIQHLALPESVGVLQAEQFHPELLVDPLAKEVLQWQLEHVREHGKAANGTVLEDQFEEITVTGPDTAIGDLVTRIRERYMRNVGRDIIRNLADLANADPLAVGKEMLKGGRQLSDLITRRGEVFTENDYHRAIALYHKRVLQGKGPSLGFKELDDHFGGIRGVTFLIAPPKAGKSWFTVNDVLQNVLEGGFPYLYSLELPAEEADMRLRCMAADIPYWKYDKRCLTPQDEQRLAQVSDLLRDNGRYHVEKPAPGERGVERMVQRALNAGATCIFFDQLQYMENRKGVNLGSANNTGDYWEVCNDLRDYSDEIPVFVVHQFNRSVLKATEMPEAQQAKGSAAIEEVATLALGMWANKEMRRSGIVQLGTLASRNCAYETWNLGVNLSTGCGLDMLGPVEEDDE